MAKEVNTSIYLVFFTKQTSNSQKYVTNTKGKQYRTYIGIKDEQKKGGVNDFQISIRSFDGLEMQNNKNQTTSDNRGFPCFRTSDRHKLHLYVLYIEILTASPIALNTINNATETKDNLIFFYSFTCITKAGQCKFYHLYNYN